MKRLFSMLLVLFAIYFLVQFAFQNFGQGHEGQYTIINNGNTFVVTEKLVSNVNNETDNYYIKINIDNTTFEFQTFSNYYGRKNIIKDIEYFSQNNLKCILPIFNGDVFEFDIMCLKEGEIVPYYSMQGSNAELDAFARGLENVGYKSILWQDSKVNPYTEESITVYADNILTNHYVAINSYRGLYTISNDNLKPIYSVKLFTNDIYKRPISGIVGKYYITADYSQQYAFNQMYIVDITNNDEKTVDILPAVDFDGYVQGVVGDSLYFYDRSNRRQYEVNTNPLGIREVGSANNGILYYDGKWTNITAPSTSAKDLFFVTTVDDQTFTGYDRVDKVGNVLSGHYYLYKKSGTIYNVYRVNVQNPNLKTYIFSTNKIDNIYYVGDYVYHTFNNEVRYFHNSAGVKTLFKNTEFDFNSSLYFGVYKK